MNGFIYQISNDINDKVYVGKTLSSIEKRFNEHCKDAFRIRCEKRPLYDTMQKYGIEHFTISLLGEYPVEELSDREVFWIKEKNSFHNGYNATTGGDGKQLYDYDKFVAKYLSGELIKDIANDFECSVDVVRNALQLANIDTSINSIKKACKGIRAKKVNGEVVKDFDSRADAVKWLQDNGITLSKDRDNIIAAIGRVANGQRKSAYGLIWENI